MSLILIQKTGPVGGSTLELVNETPVGYVPTLGLMLLDGMLIQRHAPIMVYEGEDVWVPVPCATVVPPPVGG